ncbi:MAG TPA: protein kinase [Terriglobales bacterium]|nr:protein kinase [Terriglobales bacterium]
MGLTSGTKLGPYEIDSPLGAGGMGEVYRARDTRLGRDVAVKVLPSHLSSDPELKARFEREARTISALQHPHICTLYDIGHQEGIDYLVMEFLEGETLQQRLLRGPLPVKQAVEYGIEIAGALERAHQAGIVHRDLKPGNVMVIKSGAKLLDFGLAKPVTIAGLGVSGPRTPATPTMSIPAMTAQAGPLTQQGTVVGTFQYVAPEVLQGQDADARSDVFALGAVLYEMLTGRQAFEGKSQLSIMTAILEKEPERIAAVPAQLEHVVHTCLAKEPAERWQSAREVARELRWVEQSIGIPLKEQVPRAPKTWRFWAGAVAAMLAAIALTVTVTYYVIRPAPGPIWTVSVVPPAGVIPATIGRNGPPQISPDGSRVAFVGCPTTQSAESLVGSTACSVWLQSLRSHEAHEVPDTGGSNSPFWSPDGREIAFFAEGKLKAVPADGGPVRIICDALDGRGGTWGPAGVILFSPARGGPVFRVPAEGGSRVPVTSSKAESNFAVVGSHRWPHFMPDGEHFTYNSEPNGACSDLTEMHFASLDGKEDRPLLHICTNANYANGHLIYWRDGNLIAQPFDPRRGTLSGNPVPIADHVAFDALFGFGAFSASSNGELIYRTGEGATKAGLVWYDRAGKQVSTLGENDRYSDVSISPAGSRVVADTFSNSGTNLLILDARGTRTIFSSPGTVVSPSWSPDGRQVYFASNANGPFDVYVKDVDSSAKERPLAVEKGQNIAMYPTTSRDGRYLAYMSEDLTTKRFQIHTVALTGDRTPKLFRSASANEIMPSFSPDGKWLAYESDQSGRSEVYISPFPSGNAQYQVSTNGGERPVWRHDSKEIYYRANLQMVAVKVNVKGDTIELGTPVALFEVAVRNLAGRWYDVSPDGRFLMNTSPATAQGPNFELVVHWPASLKK